MILYLGNFLSHKDINPTYSFALADKLRHNYSVRSVGSARGRLHRLAQMTWAVLTTSPKVVLLDAYATRAFWYLVLLCPLLRLRRKPFILLLHSGAWVDRWQSHPKQSQYLLKHAHAIVCTSQFLFDRMPSHQSKAQVIHNFGETLILAPLRKVFNQKILWVREYQPRYGDEEVLRLAELLMEKGCSSTITMVGPKRETLATRWNSPWPTNVQFQDRLAPEEWHALALEHSLFLNTSHVDSFPISVIQALALGLPVLSTPVGGIPEMIEHETSGWLLEIGQLEGMAHIIQRLEKNGTILGTMSEAALNRAKLFTWEAIAPQWLQLMDTFH